MAESAIVPVSSLEIPWVPPGASDYFNQLILGYLDAIVRHSYKMVDIETLDVQKLFFEFHTELQDLLPNVDINYLLDNELPEEEIHRIAQENIVRPLELGASGPFRAFARLYSSYGMQTLFLLGATAALAAYSISAGVSLGGLVWYVSTAQGAAARGAVDKIIPRMAPMLIRFLPSLAIGIHMVRSDWKVVKFAGMSALGLSAYYLSSYMMVLVSNPHTGAAAAAIWGLSWYTAGAAGAVAAVFSPLIVRGFLAIAGTEGGTKPLGVGNGTGGGTSSATSGSSNSEVGAISLTGGAVSSTGISGNVTFSNTTQPTPAESRELLEQRAVHKETAADNQAKRDETAADNQAKRDETAAEKQATRDETAADNQAARNAIAATVAHERKRELGVSVASRQARDVDAEQPPTKRRRTRAADPPEEITTEVVEGLATRFWRGFVSILSSTRGSRGPGQPEEESPADKTVIDVPSSIPVKSESSPPPLESMGGFLNSAPSQRDADGFIIGSSKFTKGEYGTAFAKSGGDVLAAAKMLHSLYLG